MTDHQHQEAKSPANDQMSWDVQPDPKNTAMAEALWFVLGNTCRICRATQSYAWNAQGPGARSAILCFNDQAGELHGGMQRIAECTRGLGSYAYLDYTDPKVSIQPPATGRMPDIQEMFDNLITAHEQACVSIDMAEDVAQGYLDGPVAALLNERLAAHRGHLWMLRAEISD